MPCIGAGGFKRGSTDVFLSVLQAFTTHKEAAPVTFRRLGTSLRRASPCQIESAGLSCDAFGRRTTGGEKRFAVTSIHPIRVNACCRQRSKPRVFEF